MEIKHLTDIILNQSTKYNNREAVRYKRDNTYASISWNEMKAQIECVSKYLLSLGLGTDDKVGIYSQNHPEWTICDFGTLGIRGVVVPIYPTAAYYQLEYIVKETEMQILCIGNDEQLENALKALSEIESLKKIITFQCKDVDDDRVVRFEDILKIEHSVEIDEKLNQQMKEASKVDLVTIVYTSGTTGEPKGVMLNHHNYIELFKIHLDRIKLTDQDISIAFLPLSHVFERSWTYYILYCGAVNFYNENPKEIIDVLPVIKPTVMCVVPRFYEKTYKGIITKKAEWPKIQQNIFDWAIKVGHNCNEYRKKSAKLPFALGIKRSIADKLVLKKIRDVFGGNLRFTPCSGSAISEELLRFFHAVGLFVNYGYGATETTATVACLRHDRFEFDNVGHVMPGLKVKTSESDNMIMVKGETVFQGYYKKPKETEEVLKDGWYYTGDMGEVREGNVLVMKERIKDIIKTSTGKYISPQKIELALSQCDLIEQLCIIGDNRKYLTALIVPIYERIQKWAQENSIKLNDKKALLKDKKVLEMFTTNLEEYQNHLSHHEKIVKFTLLHEPFSIENTMLTNSLKIRRKQVNQVYADVISEMY